MFGSSAERNGVERPARIDSGGTPRRICGTIFVRCCLKAKAKNLPFVINRIFAFSFAVFYCIE